MKMIHYYMLRHEASAFEMRAVMRVIERTREARSVMRVMERGECSEDTRDMAAAEMRGAHVICASGLPPLIFALIFTRRLLESDAATMPCYALRHYLRQRYADAAAAPAADMPHAASVTLRRHAATSLCAAVISQPYSII